MRTHYLIATVTVTAIVLAASWSPPVPAGTMYKCTEGGRTTYGDRPCAGGRVAELAVQEAPPPDPELEARLARQRALAQDIDARNAAQTAREERETRDAARREEREAQDKRRFCEQLHLQHEAADANEQRAIARAHARQKDMEDYRARENRRKRAKVMAERCQA